MHLNFNNNKYLRSHILVNMQQKLYPKKNNNLRSC